MSAMSLQEINIKRQAQTMERTLKGILHFLDDKYNDFQQMCRVFNPHRGYSPTAIKDIKEMYKRTTTKIAEARALQQLLRSKYKAYVQVDAHQQRAVEELSLMYRKDYRFFEQNKSQWEREQQAHKEKAMPQHLLSHLYSVYRESPTLPSLLLCFQGEFSAFQEIKKRITLGEKDISDMTGDEMWLLLAGVRPVEDVDLLSKLSEIFCEGLNERIRGVVLKLTSGEEVRDDVLQGMRRSLAGVERGKIKIL
jgi:hypothetical protein